jgi:two-component system response regulator YesN
MYKILLVDDEPDIVNGMANGIPWNAWGYQVVGKAGNGLEALEIIDKERPHIVLTDIRMPKMDGIQLMEHLRKNAPDIRVIILSGYSDVEYLKLSIKNHVVEYLFKPTDIEEFENTLIRIREELDEEQKKVEEIEELKQIAQDGKHYKYARLFQNLIRGYGADPAQVEEMKEELGILFENCIVLALDVSRGLGAQEILEYCNMRMTGYRDFYFYGTGDYIIGIVELPKEWEEWEKPILQYLQNLQSEIRDLYETEVSIGVSGQCRQASRLFRAYEQAEKCVRQKLFLGSLSIVLYPDLSRYRDSYLHLRKFDLEKIELFLENRETELLHKEIALVFDSYRNKMWLDDSYLDRMVMEMFSQLSLWVFETYRFRPGEVLERSDLLFSDVQQKKTLREKGEFMERILLILSDEIDNMKAGKKAGNTLVKEMKDYIDRECCSNAISLDSVAERLRKNTAYISKLFKKETGYNFSEYLIQKRMERAKELLNDYTYKVYEVAAMTGYADVSNFIKVFRKYWGVSPNEYRKGY